ncbi:MAG: hypothetical protein IPN79_00690 [Saprospiraceae bacterium]|nr:hypothetical protein [Saprospiraceae bacterium]
MNFDHLKQQSDNFRKSPHERTWKKIDFVLSTNKKNRFSGILRKTMFYAAAIFIFILSFVGWNYYTKQSEASPFYLEIVDESEYFSPLYSTQNMKSLQTAYRKQSMSDRQ